MKKTECKIIFVFITVVVLLCLTKTNVFAEDGIYAEIEKSISELNESTADFEGTDVSLRALMPQNIFSFAVNTVKKSLVGSGSALFSLIAVIAVSAVVEIFSQNLGGASRLLTYAALLSDIGICMSAANPLILSVSDFVGKLSSFMTSMTGTMTVLLYSSGNASAAAASSASAAFIADCAHLCAVRVILPSVKIAVALCAVNSLSSAVDLGGIINFIRSFCTWGLGVIFAVFGGVHSAAVKVTSSTDSIAVRGIRFSAARLVPIAGNMISESLNTVIAGMNVIKTTAGGLGIAYVIYTAIPVLLSVLAVKLTIMCGIFCARLFGVRSHMYFLESISSSLNILTAVCVFTSAAEIIIFAVFMNTAVGM